MDGRGQGLQSLSGRAGSPKTPATRCFLLLALNSTVQLQKGRPCPGIPESGKEVRVHRLQIILNLSSFGQILSHLFLL